MYYSSLFVCVVGWIDVVGLCVDAGVNVCVDVCVDVGLDSTGSDFVI